MSQGANWKQLENVENFENIKNVPWDMLNYFCFYAYAQKLLFKVENVNDFFYISISSITLTSHPAMRGLKVVCPDLKAGQKGSFSGRLSGLQARREPCG